MEFRRAGIVRGDDMFWCMEFWQAGFVRTSGQDDAGVAALV